MTVDFRAISAKWERLQIENMNSSRNENQFVGEQMRGIPLLSNRFDGFRMNSEDGLCFTVFRPLQKSSLLGRGLLLTSRTSVVPAPFLGCTTTGTAAGTACN
jgi:hypothetical protein